MRSSLSRFQQSSPMSEDEMYAKQKQLYRERGSLLLTKEQIDTLPQIDQWALEIIAQRLYGKGSQ